MRMIIIYTIIFVIIGLFIWLYITTKNKREDEKITRDIDFSNDNDDPEDDSLSDYDEYVHRVLGSSRKDDYLTDEIDEVSKNNFIEAMNDDLNTSKALSVLFDLAAKVNIAADNNDKNNAVFYASSLINLGNVLGLDLKTIELDDNLLEEKISKIKDKFDFLSAEELNNSAKEIMQKIIEYRQKVRAEKNYAEADKIRDILALAGLKLKDTKDGCIYTLNS